jgi:hypothetical protein
MEGLRFSSACSGAARASSSLQLQVRRRPHEETRLRVVGGPGFESDSVTVDDGFRKKPLKLYAGDLLIAPAK